MILIWSFQLIFGVADLVKYLNNWKVFRSFWNFTSLLNAAKSFRMDFVVRKDLERFCVKLQEIQQVLNSQPNFKIRWNKTSSLKIYQPTVANKLFPFNDRVFQTHFDSLRSPHFIVLFIIIVCSKLMARETKIVWNY